MLRTCVRIVAMAAAFVAAGPILLSPVSVRFADAASLKDICQRRCSAHRAFCLDSTLPSLSGGSAPGVCNNTCVDSYSDCSRACDSGTAANNSTCMNSCNTTLASCSTTCSQSRAACNDTYVACHRGCDLILECTSASLCGSGKVCQDNKCVNACKNNAECRTRLRSPDAVCLTTTAHKGECVLQ